MWRKFLEFLQAAESPLKEFEPLTGDIGYFARFFRSLEQLCFHMMICFYVTLIVYASLNNLTASEGATLIHFVIAWHLAAILLLLLKPLFQSSTKTPIGILLTLTVIVSLAVLFLDDVGKGAVRLVGWFQEALSYFAALV